MGHRGAPPGAADASRWTPVCCVNGDARAPARDARAQRQRLRLRALSSSPLLASGCRLRRLLPRPQRGSSGRRWTGEWRRSMTNGTRQLGLSAATCAPVRSLSPPPAAPLSPLPPPHLRAGANSAGCRRLIGARAAGATSAHRGPRRRQASARRNPRQQPGCRPRSRSGAADSAVAHLGSIGRFHRRRQPFLACLTAGWGCAQPDWSVRPGASPRKSPRRL